MKELSIEEKAKRYDEAIEIAREINNEQCAQPFNVMTKVFPELKESEDVKIIKEMKDFFSHIMLWQENFLREDYDWNAWIAWLEKQGEQKPQRIVSAEAKEAMYDKPAWSEEDDKMLVGCVQAMCTPDAYSLNDRINFEYWLKSLKDRVQPKPKQEWSEEDEDMCDSIISDKETSFTLFSEQKNWLKSLKDRVIPQPKQEWNEEDERLMKNLKSTLANLSARKLIERETEDKYVNWLKSLRPQNRWKPSEEQMEALDDFIYAKYPNIEKYGAAVKSLYQDLKKLK